MIGKRTGQLLLLLVLLIAAFLRLWQIDTIPAGFHFDESFEGLEAWRILTDSSYRPIFLTGNFGVPPLNAYANALTFWLFQGWGLPPGPTAMRVTAALFGILGVLTVYGLANELWRLASKRDQQQGEALRTLPIFAAASLAVMRWHIHFSRMGIEPVIVPVIWAGVTWLFLRGWRTQQRANFVGCGILLATGMYTYQGAWIIPLLMVPVAFHLLFISVSRPNPPSVHQSSSFNLQSSLFNLFLTAATAFLLFLPLGWFFVQNPDLLLLRPTQLAIVGETGSPADNSVWSSIWATAKMFGPFGRPGDLDPRRNIPGAPALNVWLVLPFYGGLLLALWRAWRPVYAILLIGLVGLLLPGVFSEYAPHFHRILGASAPVALLCGVGLAYLWHAAYLRKYFLHWAAVIFLVLGGITAARDYFRRWAVMPDLFYAFDVGLWELGQRVAQQRHDGAIYTSPRGEEHATLAFAWHPPPSAHTTPVLADPVRYDGRSIFPLTDGANQIPEHYAIIEHEDFRTRLLLPEVFPYATVSHEVVDSAGQVYARIYTRQPGTDAQRFPQVPWQSELGDGIALLGYDVQPAELRTGSILYLQLHWITDAKPAHNWTVFTHLLNPENGQVVAGQDSPPGYNSLPTQRWQAGWRILDEYQIQLPADLAPGDYNLAIGLYQPTGERLPADADNIMLGSVHVE